MDTGKAHRDSDIDASFTGTQGGDNHEEKTRVDTKTEAKRPALPQRLWKKLGLNMGMVILMSKGALPPVIALAIYQSTPVADLYSTIGYLAAIMSILSFAILPRAKFLQTMLLDIISVCIGACIGLLTVYSSVQARKHTTPVSGPSAKGPSPGASTAGYNSSASAVSAIWLFVNLLVANAFRASRPQLQFPVIIYSIFANVASTYAPQFPTMAAGQAFIKRLLEAFLTGFGIATAVNLFVFPISARDVVFKDAVGYINALQVGLKAQTAYLKVLEDKDMFSPADESSKKSNATAGAERLKAALGGIGAIHGKYHGDLDFAKKEIAFSKLDAKDLGEMFTLFREVMLPMHGMGSVADIFDRLAKKKGWQEETKSMDSSTNQAEKETKAMDVQQWNEIFKAVHDPFDAMTETLHEGLQHVLYTLELEKKPGKKILESRKQESSNETDLEAQGGIIKAGDPAFAEQLQTNIKKYFSSREVALRIWSKQKGIDLPESVFTNPSTTQTIHFEGKDIQQHRRDQQQLYLILYLEFLLYSTGEAILKFVQFADSKVESGVMKKRRLIVPGKRRFKKWFINMFAAEDSAADHTPDQSETGASNIYVGDSLQTKKDPEHLPPTNSWQRLGNGVRSVSHVLRSPSVAFGFRVACATMSIAILAFLKQTQLFFVEQRVVWAMIMIAIGMTVTAGSGVFGFLARVAGTFTAMCMSFIIWYVAGGRGVPAAVFVLLYVVIFLELYFLLKFPRFTPVVMITMVTQVLILGYELQVKKSGIQAAVSSGQLYYPIYLLGPYRLATVCAGCFVGFIWLYFPYPITASSELRKDLGASLYLLANYYSCVRTTIHMRLEGRETDTANKHCPVKMLEKARGQIFSKEMALLAGLRQHSAFTNFEFTLGGKFPKKQYDTIIDEVQSILYYMALISYASKNYSTASNSLDGHKWLRDFTRVIHSVEVTSEEITLMLSLLSASVTNGSPLPPYLKAPAAFELSDRLEALDADILGINHMVEPGYASFAVTQIASSLISDDLTKLIENVRNLVGEVNFTFYPLTPPNTSSETLLANSESKGKKD